MDPRHPFPPSAAALLRLQEESSTEGTEIWTALRVAQLSPNQALRQSREHSVGVSVSAPSHSQPEWTAALDELSAYAWGESRDQAMAELVTQARWELPDALQSFIHFEEPPLPLIISLMLAEWSGLLPEVLEAAAVLVAEGR